MQKVLTIAALATLAMTSDVEGLTENELNFFKKVGEGLKKAGKFVAEHPKIITTAVKILALDESATEEFEDDNLSFLDYLKPVMSVVQEAQKTTQPLSTTQPETKNDRGGRKGFIDFDDEELNGLIYRDYSKYLKILENAPKLPVPTENLQTEKRHISFDDELIALIHDRRVFGGWMGDKRNIGFDSENYVAKNISNSIAAKNNRAKPRFIQESETDNGGEVRQYIGFDSLDDNELRGGMNGRGNKDQKYYIYNDDELANFASLIKEGQQIQRGAEPTPRFRVRANGRNFAELERTKDFENSADDFFRRR